jgi:hypothetical protein
VSDRTLVMVVGPGRSGTSTMAGALAHSGFHVPNAIPPNESNPRGFFEPRWAVNFHKRLLKQSGVMTLDPDPRALERVESLTARPEVRDELRTWLAEKWELDERLVIKDPRLTWFQGLWGELAREQGVDPRFVIMIRPPAEVSASRTTYYKARDVGAVGGWINVALMTEQLTSSSPRCVVSYAQLLKDWRAELGRLETQLDIQLDPGPDTHPHENDTFIEPSLRRMSDGWGNVAVPAHLAELADRVHDVLHRMATDGDAAELSAQAAELREEYADTFKAALTLVRSDAKRTAARIRKQTATKVRATFAEQSAAPATGATVGARIRRLAGRVRRRLGGAGRAERG